MARFDVYAHPDVQLRKNTPYLLDVQNSFIHGVATRVVIPLRDHILVKKPLRDLNPIFEIKGNSVILDTTSIAAYPTELLKKPVDSFAAQASVINNALDTLLGGY